MNYKEYTVKVFESGDKLWYRNGLLHREDGPALEFVSGRKYWYLEGIEYLEEKFQKKMNPQQNCEETKNVTSLLVEIDGKKYKLTEV